MFQRMWRLLKALTKQVPQAAALVCVLLGASVIVGWHLESRTMVQVLPAAAPMQYNTAIGLLGLGAALWLLQLRRPRGASTVAAVVAVVALLTLGEYVLQVEIGIDQLLHRHEITDRTSHTGRMAPNTAVGLVLGALSIVLAARRRSELEGGAFALALVVGLTGVFSLMGYLVGFAPAYGWGRLTHMAVHTAAGLLAFSVGMVASVRQHLSARLKWYPVAAGAFVVLGSVLAWSLLEQQQQQTLELRLEARAQSARHSLENELDLTLDSLDRMAYRWQVEGGLPRRAWHADARRYIQDLQLEGIYWVDANESLRWRVERRPAPSAQVERAATLALKRFGRTGSAHFIVGSAVWFASPLRAHGERDGVLLARLPLDLLVMHALGPEPVRRKLAVKVVPAGAPVLALAGPLATDRLDIAGSDLRVVAFPGSEGRWTRRLPDLALLAGLALAILLGFTLSLAGARRELLTQAKAAEARLRRFIELSPDGFVVIDAEGGVVLANRRAEQLFGHEKLDRGPIEELLPGVDAILTASRNTSGAAPGHHIRGVGADGSRFDAAVTVAAVSDDPPLVGIAVRDVTDERTRQRRLTRLARELERSNQDLEQFAYVASHDLQEPLRMVASYVQLLERRYRGQLDAKADQYIEYAVEGASRMQTLINDLLAFSRAGRSGNLDEPVDLNAVMRDVQSALAASIEETGASVRVVELPVVTGNRSLLSQVVQNLVGNALKHRSERPPRVEIEAQRSDDGWTVSVRDNGVGIDPKYFERIFVIFQRLQPRDDTSGTGIGLALTKRIVERHGGRIWVESVQGVGSTFRFTLPDREAEAPAH